MNCNKIILGIGIGSLFTITSCDKIKDFKDLNTNPNQTTTPIPSALLTNVEAGMGDNLGFNFFGLSFGAGLYTQYFSETQYTEASRYESKNNFQYDAYFAGPLEDLQNIIDYNSDPATAEAAAAFGSNQNQIAIARILKVAFVKFLTDGSGDLPYFEALKGNAQLTPKYDPQQAIYADLLKELTEAVAQFNDIGLKIQGDILFDGDVGKWKKYANSLRLLLALNMRKVDAATGQTQFQAALNDPAGIIADNSDNATIYYPGGNFPNPVFNFYGLGRRIDVAVSETMTSQLSALNDPRITVFASSANGFPYGYERPDAVNWMAANADWARILAGDITPDNSPWTFLSAANIYLARAEAAQLGWTTESVATMFANGIQASFDQWGLGSAASYIAAQGVPDEQKIAVQEWLAFFPNGLEGWNVYRRTGFPILTPADSPLGISNGIPRRANYGTNDYSYNPANVAAAAAGYTANGQADSQWARIWWDQ